MKSLIIPFIITTLISFSGYTQSRFTNDPSRAELVTSDVRNFWIAFDSLSLTKGNPFKEYIRKGSIGLQDFIPSRILNADELYKKVLENKEEYLKSRNVLDSLPFKEKQIKEAYKALKALYPAAQFPPVYFVVGRLNSGGTSSEHGLIIGVEKLKNLSGLASLVAHELIHFQQNSGSKSHTLLQHSVMEGGADFIGEKISGINISKDLFKYGEEHMDELAREFVKIMDKENYTDWLYETSGKDKRPNDLGYWMGYKIVQAYYKQSSNKAAALVAILDISQAKNIMLQGGFLRNYLN